MDRKNRTKQIHTCSVPSGRGPAYSVCDYVCEGKGGDMLTLSLTLTLDLRPFYDRPLALTQEGRSLVNDVCECVHG